MHPQIQSFRERILRARKATALEKIGALIPGYVGYADRKAMRHTDKLLRMRVHDVLSDAKRTLQTKLERTARGLEADQLRTLDRCRKELDTLAAQFRYAPYGASGFFADFKVKEAELEEMHEMDLHIAAQLEPLTEASENSDFPALQGQIQDISEQLEARNRFLQERK